MRRLLQLAIITILLLFAPTVSAEIIRDFGAEMNVDENGKFTITETIRYDFEELDRHGIYRQIPYSYSRNGFNYKVRLKVDSVVDDQGIHIPYSTSYGGGELEIKIGDADKYVTGEQAYVITYTAERALNWFDGEPEVYWNVTGNEWLVDIESARITVTSTHAISADKTECFSGSLGSQEANCTIKELATGGLLINSETELFSGEGLTFATRLPAGSIPEPTAWERAWDLVRDNWALALPVVSLLLLIYLYRRFGKDPAGRGTIIPEYEPPEKMTPAMIGYLIDEMINPRDVSSAIINLAVKGYLKIHYKDKTLGHTFKLEKLKEAGNDLSKFERGLFKEIFSKESLVELKDLKKTLPSKLNKLKSDLRDEAQTQEYFPTPPNQVKGIYMTIGILLMFGGFFLFGLWLAMSIGLIVSGALFIGFSPAMPRRTDKGVLITEQIKGFKHFLTITEKERLKFHNAPKKKPEEFFSFLPYAIALAVEKEWANQFRDLTLEQPDWYGGQDWSAFNAYVFASAMTDFTKTTNSQAFTAPSKSGGSGGSGFGGGGFSGGGFGGGGGGSW
ncbi:DUF2207 domain-containing protein [Patescibacteria group bacterium]